MIEGRWFVTPHAVQRYRERHRPDISRRQALGELSLISEIATRKCRMRSGDYEFAIEQPRKIRLVVSHDSEGELPALVTVLPGARVGWIDLRYDVEQEFDRLQVGGWDDHLELLDRESLAMRRAKYAIERRENSILYRTITYRSRRSSKDKTPAQRIESARRERERHRIERAERVAGKTCARVDCYNPLTARRGTGPTPIFCSVRCSHLVAGKNYWKRNAASQRAAARMRRDTRRKKKQCVRCGSRARKNRTLCTACNTRELHRQKQVIR